MKTQILKTTLLISLSLWIFSSCKKDKNEPQPENPTPPANTGEIITTMKLIFTDTLNAFSSTYIVKDPDGDGGQSFTQYDSVVTLASNSVYRLEILLLDESKNPIDTISKEVLAEGADHMFFFTPNTTINSSNPISVNHTGSNTLIKYSDLDNASTPRGIGLKTLWSTSNSTGSTKHPLTIKLKHQPGVKDGTEAPGETDIELNFKLIIQ